MAWHGGPHTMLIICMLYDGQIHCILHDTTQWGLQWHCRWTCELQNMTWHSYTCLTCVIVCCLTRDTTQVRSCVTLQLPTNIINSIHCNVVSRIYTIFTPRKFLNGYKSQLKYFCYVEIPIQRTFGWYSTSYIAILSTYLFIAVSAVT